MDNPIIVMSPAQVEQLIANSVAKGIQMALGSNGQKSEPLPPTIPLKKAAEISGKTPNALRVQISIGNLKCMHRGSRIYLDTDYFQRWLRGEDEPESNPLEILK